MSKMTISEILSANQLWTTSKNAWADFLLGIEKNASYLDTNVSHPLAAAWTGTAQQLATGQVKTQQAGLLTSTKQISVIQGLIEDFNGQLSGWQQQLEPLLQSAKSQGFDVAEDGTVTIPPLSRGAQAIANHDPDSVSIMATERASASKLQDEIQAILNKASAYDDNTAAVLRNQMPTLGVALQNPTPWESKYSSLSQIAQAYYGNANMWPVIYEANKNIIENPNAISTSMKLVIPAVAGHPGTTASLTPAQAALLAQASGSATPSTGAPPLHLTPGQEREIAIANGVSPSQLTPSTGTPHPAGVTYTGGNPNDDSYRSSQGGASLPSTTTGTDPIPLNSQGLYLPPNATQDESNAS